MIISCPKCKIKFRVTENKIPSHGRRVQCSQCSYQWKALGKAEISSSTGKIFFIFLFLIVSFLILFIGSVIIFGDKIPMPEFISTWLESIGIPITEGELFGRSYKR